MWSYDVNHWFLCDLFTSLPPSLPFSLPSPPTPLHPPSPPPLPKGDVRLELTTPITTIEPVVAYNNSYVRSGSILTAPTDTTINHFVVACVAVGSNQSDIGQWYYPDGSLVGTALPPSALAGVTQERRLGKVLLYRDGCLECSSQVGVYRCIIPDLTGVEQSLYVGLYTASDPSRPISSEANSMTSSYTCIYMCMKTCTHVHICTHLHMHVYINTHAHFEHPCTHLHISTHLHTSTCRQAHIYTQAHMYT